MRKLVIIGANNFQLPLIIKAKELGYETHVFAWEEGSLGKEFADFFYPVSIVAKEEILEISKKIKPDGVLSIASDLASITVNYLAYHLGLVGNSLKCTEITTDKYLMRKALSEKDLPCPRFFLIDKNNTTDIPQFNYPIIVKPTDRSGSRGVTKLLNESELPTAIYRALDESFSKRGIIETFIEGREFSVEMISWKGEHEFLQITEKETFGPPWFVEKAQHQPANLSDSTKTTLIEIIKNSLSALNVDYGASHSEVIITKDKEIFITEIGARMGGDYIGSDLVKLSTGFDFLKAVISISVGNKPEVCITKNNYSGVCYTDTKKGRVTQIIDNSKKYNEVIKTEIYVKQGQAIGDIVESNLRTACFLYCSTTNKFDTNKQVVEIVTSNL